MTSLVTPHKEEDENDNHTGRANYTIQWDKGEANHVNDSLLSMLAKS
jgi:hypothetical protein